MKTGQKGVGEISGKYRQLISSAIPGLDKGHMLGIMLSKSERPDVAYAGGVIEEIVSIIGGQFCSAVSGQDCKQFQRNYEIPF